MSAAPSPPGLAIAAWAACALAAAAIACAASAPGGCRDAPLSADAAAALPAIERRAPFPLTRPCALAPGFEVASVFGDTLPEGGARHPRFHFLVRRGEERAYTLSQTGAAAPFRDIPLGSRRLRAAAGGLVASGFAGPAGTGGEIAYLRWRRDGVTHELAAALRPWLTERDVRAIAAALMRR